MEKDYVMRVRLCHCNEGGYVELLEDEGTERKLPLLQKES